MQHWVYGVCVFMAMIHLAIAAQGSLVMGGERVYQSSFEPDHWVGHLMAYPLRDDGTPGLPIWDAADLLPPWNKRKILTWSPEPTPEAAWFDWQYLSEAQKHALSSEQVLRYLKGDDALEMPDGQYRHRKNKLGDIIHSHPLYVKEADFGYQRLPQTHGGGLLYRDFVERKKQRDAMLYVGANDGMLHVIDALTGIEQWAFIPNAVYRNLTLLSQRDYAHRYFVDGQCTQGDAYLNTGMGSAWKTIVLGSTGLGAKSIFAIDATMPLSVNPANILWERSAEDDGSGVSDNDMGYMRGQAFVIRLRNAIWAAAYGNGYGSSSNKAVLYFVDALTGKLLTKLAPEIDSVDEPNGLSTPAFLFDAQRQVMATYAGDLQGNLWKFDMSAPVTSAWKTAFAGHSLFVAKDNNGRAQSILQQALMARHPKDGRMVLFGTDELVDEVRQSSVRGMHTQSFYGVWDKEQEASPISGREQLQQQTLVVNPDGERILTNHAINWAEKRGWYIDLPDPGEYFVGKPLLVEGIVWLLTFSPVTEKSQLLGVAYSTGGAAGYAIFPGQTVSRVSMPVPASVQTPVLQRLPDGRHRLVIQGIDGTSHSIDIARPKQTPLRTWHQLAVPF